MPAEGNGDLQTLICVLVARLFRIVESCLLTKLNTPYLGYTLQMKVLFRGLPVMVHS